MSYTWFVNLKGRVDKERFDSVCSKIGIVYSPNGNIYYDQRVIGERELGIGGVEIDFGGIKQGGNKNPYATHLTISANASERRYDAMKKTALDLGSRLPFKNISGDWFDDVTDFDEATGDYKSVPYKADVFRMIEKQ